MCTIRGLIMIINDSSLLFIQLNQPGDFVRMLYQARMRDLYDKDKVIQIYTECFGDQEIVTRSKTQLCCFEISCDEIKVNQNYHKLFKLFKKKLF